MKYFMAVDKGPFEDEKKRFQEILLDKVRVSLEEDSLQRLVLFTTRFLDEESMKDFLIKKKVLESSLQYFDLVFVNKENRQVLKIPYKGDMKYLDLNNLEMIMIDRSLKYPFYIDTFLNSYFNILEGGNRKVFPKEYYELKKYALSPLKGRVLPEILKRFVESEVYNKVGKRYVPNYEAFVDLAMVIKNLDDNIIKLGDIEHNKQDDLEQNKQYKLF